MRRGVLTSVMIGWVLMSNGALLAGCDDDGRTRVRESARDERAWSQDDDAQASEFRDEEIPAAPGRAQLAQASFGQYSPGPPPGAYGGGFDVSLFYYELAPYGEWVVREPYGWVWIPYDVTPSWRPYSHGHWVWTECGWTWVSYEPFGWATYHYGRWYYDPWYGWAWIPGTEWSPAWVAWRAGRGWIGWAPLPPAAVYRPGFGFDFDLVSCRGMHRFSWCFVPARYFCEPQVIDHIVRPNRSVSIFNLTVNLTNYSVVNQRFVNKSLKLEEIEKIVRRPVPRYKIYDVEDVRHARGGNIRKDLIELFRPKLKDAKPAKTPKELFRPLKERFKPEDFRREFDRDRRVLDERMELERRRMEERHQRELKKPPMGIDPNELRRSQELERDALKEQMQRERRLLERFNERVQKGQFGNGKVDRNRFRLTPPGDDKDANKGKDDQKKGKKK